jgi:hypothetical protein
MTDEQLAAMHRLLADYHRKLAREAALDVVQKYHADLAQRFADEAAQIPRRTAALERLRELEKEPLSTNDIVRRKLGTGFGHNAGTIFRLADLRTVPWVPVAQATD